MQAGAFSQTFIFADIRAPGGCQGQSERVTDFSLPLFGEFIVLLGQSLLLPGKAVTLQYS